MSIPVLYGFLLDDALRLRKTVDSSNGYDQGYGVLEGETAAYIVNKTYLSDNRNMRLSVLNSAVAKGQLRVVFDSKRFEALDSLANLDNTKLQCLFNIIERIYLQQGATDSAIESQLTINSNFTGYVKGSFNHSLVQGSALISDIDNTTTTIQLMDWYEFEYNDNNGCNFICHFWVNNIAFKNDYPFTTITSIIPPYNIHSLLIPEKLLAETNVNILTDSSNYIFDQTNLETIARDQNGIYIYRTKYTIDKGKTISLPFALPYCGAKEPKSLECREAIKNYIQKETSISDDELLSLFPELFVNSRFYIVPLWDVYSELTDRDVYNSVWSLSVLKDKIEKIFMDYDEEWRNKYLEILLNAQNKMWCICLPDKLNTKLFSILKQHPTYQDYSSQMTGWRYMEKATQEFAGKLIRCMAVMNGIETSSEYTQIIDSDFTYLTFITGQSEYYVMNKESYLARMEIL